MPQMVPTQWLADEDLKNDPCPQSCMMMKARTVNPPAGKANARVSQ